VSFPFTTAQGRERGLEEWHLRSKRKWQRVAHGIYAPAQLATSPITLLQAARIRVPPSAVFSGLTSAWLHGLDTPPTVIEVTVPPGTGISGRAGMKVRRSELKKSEVVVVRGVQITSIDRTLSDVSAQLSLEDAVVLTDRALYLRRTDLKTLKATAEAASGRIGITAFRRVLTHAEPKAASHMETRMRMTIVLGGLPRPEAQVPIYDSHGNFIGRPDLYYPEQRLGIEYDGAVHKNQLAEDNRRQNLLLEAGVRLLRFTAADVLSKPDLVVAQVQAMLS
jgi:very-short-patch-repair endonuclease